MIILYSERHVKEVFMKKTKTDISQSMKMLVFIILSGGLQDAYSYFCRGGVFANAQTGNIVFLSVNIVEGNVRGILKYLVPITFFALGAILAKTLFFAFRNKKTHWKQVVLLSEAFALFLVGFMPNGEDDVYWNLVANAIVSFACAMQVLAFDRIYGNDFSSTMCIGNMVRMSGALVTAVAQKDKEAFKRFGLYLSVVVIFAVGAGAGYLLEKKLDNYAIMFSSLLTFMASFAFFGNRNSDGNRDDENARTTAVTAEGSLPVASENETSV